MALSGIDFFDISRLRILRHGVSVIVLEFVHDRHQQVIKQGDLRLVGYAVSLEPGPSAHTCMSAYATNVCFSFPPNFKIFISVFYPQMVTFYQQPDFVQFFYAT